MPQSAINVHGKSTGISAASTAAPREEGFWASLFGGSPDHDTTVYERSVEGGSTVLTVKTPDSHVTRVMDILESHKPIDIDERAASYGMATAPAAMPAANPVAPAATAALRTDTVAGDGMMQLSEEKLSVGKRLVTRGGTRIRRFVVETPVEESAGVDLAMGASMSPPSRCVVAHPAMHPEDVRPVARFGQCSARCRVLSDRNTPGRPDCTRQCTEKCRRSRIFDLHIHEQLAAIVDLLRNRTCCTVDPMPG